MVTSKIRTNGWVLGGVLAIGVLTVGNAHATILPLQYNGLDGSSTNVTVYNSNLLSGGIYVTPAGALSWTQTNTTNGAPLGSTFTTYCIELNQGLPSNVQNYNVVSNVGSLIGYDDANSIAKLWHQYDAGNLTGDSATAFQLVIWNVIYDTSLDYSLNYGLLSVSNMTSSVKNIAEGMLNWLLYSSLGAPMATLTALTNPYYQDQIAGPSNVGNPPAVPEPATLGIGLLTVASLTLAGRNRRRSSR